MTTLQEYDLEFKQTNIFKGQGLCKLATGIKDSKYQEEDGWKEKPTLYTQNVPYVPLV